MPKLPSKGRDMNRSGGALSPQVLVHKCLHQPLEGRRREGRLRDDGFCQLGLFFGPPFLRSLCIGAAFSLLPDVNAVEQLCGRSEEVSVAVARVHELIDCGALCDMACVANRFSRADLIETSRYILQGARLQLIQSDALHEAIGEGYRGWVFTPLPTQRAFHDGVAHLNGPLDGRDPFQSSDLRRQGGEVCQRSDPNRECNESWPQWGSLSQEKVGHTVMVERVWA